jgi:hypothetical protein
MQFDQRIKRINMKKIIGFCLFVSCSLTTLAQNDHPKNAGVANKSPIESAYVGFSIPASDDVELLPEFTHIISKNESENKEVLEMMKKAKLKQKQDFLQHDDSAETGSAKKTRATIDPVVSVGYNALSSSGTPSDNSIAVNKTGQLVAVVNSSLRIYNATTGAGINGTVNLDNFFATLGTNLNTCDPKVIFDQQSDRFIVFAQNCDGNSDSSQLFVAFSKTADPTAGWYFYKFSGNIGSIIGVPTWFDYPKIGVSNHDLFITGNLFDNNMDYVQSVVYQIDKTKCYTGTTLASTDAVVWYDIGNSPFTLVPMSNGQAGGYGNTMLLVANSAQASELGIYEIDNTVQLATVMTNQTVNISNNFSPADAIQKGSSVTLSTGDSRGMDGFYLNGIIHFVFHSDVGNGFAGVNYYRLQKVGPNWTSLGNKVIKITGKDCTYPSITSMGWNSNDQSAILAFNYVSSVDYPGVKAVFVNENFIASTLMEVKTGSGAVNLSGGSGTTRWGDYSSISRVQNATVPTAWCFSMYGNTSTTWTNYFAKITSQAWGTGTEELNTSANEATVFPNPVLEDYYRVKLDLPLSGMLQIKLLDINGRLVKDIFSVHAVKGQNLFSFNKGALASGSYIVSMLLNHKLIKNEKISIVH